MKTNRYTTESEARKANITGFYKFLIWLEIERCFTLSQLSLERTKETYLRQYGAFFTIIGEVEQYVPNSKTIAAETKKLSINAFLIPVFRVGITQF